MFVNVIALGVRAPVPGSSGGKTNSVWLGVANGSPELLVERELWPER